MHDVDSDVTRGDPTIHDPVHAGDMIWPPPDSNSTSSTSAAASERSSRAQQQAQHRKKLQHQQLHRPCGVEGRPHSRLTVVMQNNFGQALEEEMADKYRIYAMEKERQAQPLKFKMTRACKDKIQRVREQPHVPRVEDRWLMKKFQNVPSHFEQDRMLAKALSAPDLQSLEASGSHQVTASRSSLPRAEERVATKAVLNWPMRDEESVLVPSRISATPSSSHVSTQQAISAVASNVPKPDGSQVSAMRPMSYVSAMQPVGSQLSTAVPSDTRPFDGDATQTASNLIAIAALKQKALQGSTVSGSLGAKQRPASAGNLSGTPSQVRSAQLISEASANGAVPTAGMAMSKGRPSSSRPPVRSASEVQSASTVQSSRIQLSEVSQSKVRPSSSQPALRKTQEESQADLSLTLHGRAASAGRYRPRGRKPCRSTLCW